LLLVHFFEDVADWKGKRILPVIFLNFKVKLGQASYELGRVQ